MRRLARHPKNSRGPHLRYDRALGILAFDAGRPKLRHIGLYARHAVVAGDGDAVVSVLDKEGIAQLVQAYRRKHLVAVERKIHAFPSLSRCRAKRHEAPVEVPAASHAPDDLLRIDDPYPLADPVVCSERASNLVEGR